MFSVPFLASSRCVLIMGDDGLQIYSVGSFGAKLVESVAWGADSFEKTVATILVKKCGRRPVVILSDMVEQHYRKEIIPQVSPLDRNSVIKRRLSVAFPNSPVRAAMRLRSRSSGVSYLFAAVPSSVAFATTMDAVRKSMVPVTGFFLLPVESGDMVEALARKKTPGGHKRAAWTVFIGQHHNGGLRQIVTQGGNLALTRMTPIIDTDAEPDVWARDVANEFQSTMSYLSRLGYTPEDGLDVFIIGAEESHLALQRFIETECNLNLMTVDDAAAALGIRIGVQAVQRCVDPLHAAWAGRKSKFIMPMAVPALERFAFPRRMAALVMMLLMAGSAFLAFQIFMGAQNLLVAHNDRETEVQRNMAAAQDFQTEVDRQKALGFDFVLTNASLNIYQVLEQEKMRPLPIIEQIGRALGKDLRIDNLTIRPYEGGRIQKITNTLRGDDSEVSENISMFETVFTLSFPSEMDPEAGVRQIIGLQNRLEIALPDYDVRITRQVADLSYTGNFTERAGENSSEQTKEQDFEAEIVIRGPVPRVDGGAQ